MRLGSSLRALVEVVTYWWDWDPLLEHWLRWRSSIVQTRLVADVCQTIALRSEEDIGEKYAGYLGIDLTLQSK